MVFSIWPFTGSLGTESLGSVSLLCKVDMFIWFLCDLGLTSRGITNETVYNLKT